MQFFPVTPTDSFAEGWVQKCHEQEQTKSFSTAYTVPH